MKRPIQILSITFGKLGSWVALVLSFVVNKSIWWGLLHMLLGWIYVIYWVIKYSKVEELIKGWMK